MAMTIRADSDAKSTRQRVAAGCWIPWVFVGLFLVVLAVNGTMIGIAISTFNGLKTTNAYEKGLAYNDRLAAAAEQEELGWHASWHMQNLADGKVRITLDLVDRLDQPIRSANVRARLDRPLQAGHERSLPFEELAPGRYAAAITLPLTGQWDVRLVAEARDHRYQLAKRIQVR